MTRFPPAAGGSQKAYTYVQDGYPTEAVEEGQTLYHVTENRAYVYDGGNWIEQTVTDHSELSGITAADHRSDANIESVIDGSAVSVASAADAGSLGGVDADQYPKAGETVVYEGSQPETTQAVNESFTEYIPIFDGTSGTLSGTIPATSFDRVEYDMDVTYNGPNISSGSITFTATCGGVEVVNDSVPADTDSADGGATRIDGAVNFPDWVSGEMVLAFDYNFGTGGADGDINVTATANATSVKTPYIEITL
ncbi:hypothetical protein [Halorubrum sp. HHNYT27]|uniref:hypothetical protein n=1 Tax=Halorubrum sp. HHNYT27 TaxID=3402275 RepID=UPI003EBEC7E7